MFLICHLKKEWCKGRYFLLNPIVFIKKNVKNPVSVLNAGS